MKYFIILSVLLSGCSTVGTGVSMAVWGASGKTPTDHALSYATDKDCKTIRVISQYKNEYICENKPLEQKVYKLRKLENVKEWDTKRKI